MNLTEAKQNAKDLNQTLALLIAATEGISEADFAHLQARKESLEGAIADAQKRLKDASAFAEDKIAQAKADTDAKLEEFKRQLKDAENSISAARAEARVSRETMREAIANEKAALQKEKQDTLSRLDGQIAAKQKALNDLNAAIEAARARFA